MSGPAARGPCPLDPQRAIQLRTREPVLAAPAYLAGRFLTAAMNDSSHCEWNAIIGFTVREK
jgi:hypothetical protein